MQIKTTVRYHFTLVRVAIINKPTNNKCWRGCGEKGTLVYCWWECRLVQPLWKTVWNILRKLKIELPLDPAIPLLGLYPKNAKTPIHLNTFQINIYYKNVTWFYYYPINLKICTRPRRICKAISLLAKIKCRICKALPTLGPHL